MKSGGRPIFCGENDYCCWQGYFPGGKALKTGLVAQPGLNCQEKRTGFQDQFLSGKP